MEEEYALLRAVVQSRAILSLGLACFHWTPLTSNNITTTPTTGGRGSECTTSTVQGQGSYLGVEVQVFNVWLLNQHSYTVDPSSAKFLVAHGFDFNKQFSQGLPYIPPSARAEVGL